MILPIVWTLLINVNVFLIALSLVNIASWIERVGKGKMRKVSGQVAFETSAR